MQQEFAGLTPGRRLYRGAGGLAGELAHIHVEDDGSLCRCGGRGCLMTTFNTARLIDGIRQALNRLTPPAVASQVRITGGLLGHDGELRGAAVRACQRHFTGV